MEGGESCAKGRGDRVEVDGGRGGARPQAESGRGCIRDVSYNVPLCAL